MKALDGYQLAKLAEFMKGLTKLTAETGVSLSTLNPWVEVNGDDAGELGWSTGEHGLVTYVLREHIS